MSSEENSPTAYFERLSKHWEEIGPKIYLANDERFKIGHRLNKVLDLLCDAEYRPVKSEDDRQLRDMNSVKLLTQTTKLIGTFKDIRNTVEARPEADKNLLEELNILVTDVSCLRYAIKNRYELLQPPTPSHRKRMNVRNDHPNYPFYPEGILTSDELVHLHNIRDALEIIHKADSILVRFSSKESKESLPADADFGKALLKKHPNAIMFIGSAPPETKEELNRILQDGYATSYNKGVALLSRAFGPDGAENMMDREAEAIKVFYATPKESPQIGVA